LIAYIQYAKGITINEDMLFCKPIKRRATTKEFFKIVDDFMKEIYVKQSDCVGVCTDAACVMVGNKGGLQALIKQLAPEAMWTHCMIHHESPAMKELCPELSEVMDSVIRPVHYIKDLSIEKQTFCRIVQGNGGTISDTPVLL
jgi:hypothetical protein